MGSNIVYNGSPVLAYKINMISDKIFQSEIAGIDYFFSCRNLIRSVNLTFYLIIIFISGEKSDF